MKTCPRCHRPIPNHLDFCTDRDDCFRARLHRLTLPELRFIFDNARWLSRDRRTAIELEIDQREHA